MIPLQIAIRNASKILSFLRPIHFQQFNGSNYGPLVGGFHVYFRKGIWLSQMCVMNAKKHETAKKELLVDIIFQNAKKK